MGRRDKDFLGLPVVSLDEAAVVGEVEGLIVDDRTARVSGFLLDLGIYEARAVAFGDLTSVGDDSIVVRSTSLVKPLSEQPEQEETLRRGAHISESVALTDGGDIVGSAGDYYVDTDIGTIAGVELIAEEQDGERTYLVPASGLVRIGEEVVLFAADFKRRAVHSIEAL